MYDNICCSFCQYFLYNFTGYHFFDFLSTDGKVKIVMKYTFLKSKSIPLDLQQIAQPPKMLHLAGQIPDLPRIAIVGTRRVTDYGRQITYRLSYDLARAGLTIVSGLALGVDTIAHQAALDAGGKTIAVLGSGLDNIYPSSNQRLAQDIIKQGGALLSEYPASATPFKSHFPARNRIIAGLSLATIVTEADSKSGSLITANYALVENRLVMAVPGNVFNPRSCGPNNLIKAGAIVVSDAVDVLASLGLTSPKLATKPVKADSPQEALILKLISEGICDNQSLIEQSELEAAQFAHLISLMEITGKIRNLGGGQWAVKK